MYEPVWERQQKRSLWVLHHSEKIRAFRRGDYIPGGCENRRWPVGSAGDWRVCACGGGCAVDDCQWVEEEIELKEKSMCKCIDYCAISVYNNGAGRNTDETKRIN